MTQVKADAMPESVTQISPDTIPVNPSDPTQQLKLEVDDTFARGDDTTSPISPDILLRSSSSKIANLRAAFEKHESNAQGKEPVRRSFSRSPAKEDESEAEIVRLKLLLEKEVALRQTCEEKLEHVEAEVKQLQDRQDNGVEEELARRVESLQREKDIALDDASNAQRQLSDLKRSISTATRVESEMVTDATFIQEMGLLYHEVQNFVVNQFRRASIDTPADELNRRLDSVSVPKDSDTVRNLCLSLEPAVKLQVFQAVVTYYLLDIFNDPLLFGLSAQHEWLRGLHLIMDGFPAILTPSALNKWRSITLDLIRESEEMKLTFDTAIKDSAEAISHALTTIAGLEESTARITALTSIVKRTVTLSHLFRVQRAQYTFFMPSPNRQLDSKTMEDISVDQGSLDRTTICALFPSVLKISDDNGDILNVCTVVIKARVLCRDGPGPEDDST